MAICDFDDKPCPDTDMDCDDCPRSKEKGEHEYGTIGEPIFICSKNFDKPIIPKNPDWATEPCGHHQADIWCIIRGQVCPHLIMGMKPKEKD